MESQLGWRPEEGAGLLGGRGLRPISRCPRHGEVRQDPIARGLWLEFSLLLLQGLGYLGLGKK